MVKPVGWGMVDVWRRLVGVGEQLGRIPGPEQHQCRGGGDLRASSAAQRGVVDLGELWPCGRAPGTVLWRASSLLGAPPVWTRN